MNGLKYIYAFVLLLAAFSLTGFYAFDQEDQEEEFSEIVETKPIPPLVQKALDKKIARYQKTIMDKCRERAFEAAEAYIDSLVAEELKFQASDTLKFPAKPVRPNLREPIILNDSTDIVPIIPSRDSIE